MTRRKRSLFLALAVCIALVAAWLTRAGFIRMPGKEAKSGQQTETARYTVEHPIQTKSSDVAIVDRSVQFTFSGDAKISSGSLGKMTMQMHHDEVEIATRLARDITFP